MKKTTRQQGFTLIELMIVVAVIGVLSAVAFPAYQDYVKKGEAASGLATLKSLITPAEMIYQDEGSLSTGVNLVDDLGISSGSNTLGTISVSALNDLQFQFSDGSLKDETITLSRDTDGWTCQASANMPEMKGCNN